MPLKGQQPQAQGNALGLQFADPSGCFLLAQVEFVTEANKPAVTWNQAVWQTPFIPNSILSESAQALNLVHSRSLLGSLGMLTAERT